MKQRVISTSIVVALVIVALTCVFLTLPNQFAQIRGTFYSGFETLFNYGENGNAGFNYLHENVGGRVSVSYIFIIVFTLGAIASLLNYKKGSGLVILSGSLFSITGLMYFMMRIWLTIVYGVNINSMNWVTYVNGALLLLLGAWLIYLGVKSYQEEKNHLMETKAQKYSYLKNK